MSNHLADESSPYLLQHADNPVDWFPWCEAAFREAQAQDKPVFLSIGYSSCHWCHVMAHESFEDAEIARLLNERFISIKVDREERPDVDRVYMEAVQAMTGTGGWPLSVFLTPSRKPFFGGTYWPPRERAGMPGFAQVLRAVAKAWHGGRNDVAAQADTLVERLGAAAEEDESGEIDRETIGEAHATLLRWFDDECGGFGGAPKFPSPLALRFALRQWHASGRAPLPAMVGTTLDRMADGGIYDHLGGGFHRYSTDRHWLVPHFEKMLYDNAMLAACYLEAWTATGRPRWSQVVEETIEYVLGEMTHDGGAFFTSRDADSDGHEGTYYLWTPDRVHDMLDADAARTFCAFYDVTDEGNFGGQNILHRPVALARLADSTGRAPELLEAELAESRRKLLAARESRAAPGRDEKILASWNGLMIDAMARAGAALGQTRWLDAAARAAEFVLDEMGDGSYGLRHWWCDGRAGPDGYLDDYASMAEALVTLYETRFEPRWLDAACRLADSILARFCDRSRGGFFYTAEGHEPMIARPRDMHDSSIPSGGGLATMALLRLAKLCGREDYWQVARGALRSAADSMGRYPLASGQMLLALQMYLAPPLEIAIVGGEDPAEDRDVLLELHRRFVPNKVVGYASRESIDREPAVKILDQKQPRGSGPTVYVCQGTTCRAPVTGIDAAVRTWSEMAGVEVAPTQTGRG